MSVRQADLYKCASKNIFEILSTIIINPNLHFKHKNFKSKFAVHLLENQHSIGPIKDIMEILYTTNKGRLMDNLEKFYIYVETSRNNQINDKNRVKSNTISDVLVPIVPYRAPTDPYLHSVNRNTSQPSTTDTSTHVARRPLPIKYVRTTHVFST
jgi:hypothetical protein